MNKAQIIGTILLLFGLGCHKASAQQYAYSFPDINHQCPEGYSHQGSTNNGNGWCTKNDYDNIPEKREYREFKSPVPSINNQCPQGYGHEGPWCNPLK